MVKSDGLALVLFYVNLNCDFMSFHLPLLPRQMSPLKHKVLTTPCSLCSHPDHNLAINCLPFSLTGGVPSHRETYCTVRGRSSSKGKAVHYNGTYVYRLVMMTAISRVCVPPSSILSALLYALVLPSVVHSPSLPPYFYCL